ncbi:MAG: adenosylcobinamide-phosphate synthase CbiB [Caldilinea sp.]|nr:adenosylcobinamide-phosphate synthase CbiB [Caldilinea sp.]MDW8441578.1 adenosylcobinamide-phosphate synthase CbiB [Caldilineaceae bacterium]
MAEAGRRGRAADRRGLTLLLALAFDVLWGDPNNRRHPVAWMGTAIARLWRCAPRQGRAAPFLFGLCLAGGGAAASALTARLFHYAFSQAPTPVAVLLEAISLKMTFSLRGLLAAGRSVEAALEQGDLDTARRRLAWHLVSRDVSRLDASQVAAATIESLAENLSDGTLAPLFYYALVPKAEWGLAAAYAYRFLNTADAMLGYRDVEREWLGKAPARLDDVANLLPARATALLIVACARVVGGDRRRAWRIWRRDARQTASPNAGHPMAAMAGALGVELEKVGHYVLGAGLASPKPEDIARARGLVGVAAGICIGIIALLHFIRR